MKIQQKNIQNAQLKYDRFPRYRAADHFNSTLERNSFFMDFVGFSTYLFIPFIRTRSEI